MLECSNRFYDVPHCWKPTRLSDYDPLDFLDDQQTVSANLANS